jgi:hypothetical protein
MARRPPPTRRKRRRPRRPRPEQPISVFREGYLRFLDFFDNIFPSPREIGFGEGEGEIAMLVNRLPVLIVYTPFYLVLWLLSFLIGYPICVIQAAFASSEPPRN